MKSNQIGRFRVDADVLYDRPDDLAAVFAWAKIVPCRCEMLFASRELEYQAVSKLFEPIERGDMIPEYTIWRTVDKNGVVVDVWAEKVTPGSPG